MSGSNQQDIILHWAFPLEEDGRDLRTFDVRLDLGEDMAPLHLYRFMTIPGVAESVTTFERWNINARRWEIAGEIHWTNNYSGQVQFGLNEYRIQELRRRKKSNSKSRRFTMNNVEYKWQQKGNESGLLCVDSGNKELATWIQTELKLVVAPIAEELLDQLVVTCLLNLWFRALGHW